MKCGNPLQGNERFCSECGAETTFGSEQVFYPQPITPTQAAPQESAPDTPPEPADIPVSEPKKRHPLLLACCISAAVVALGILAAILLLGRNNKSAFSRMNEQMATVRSFSFQADTTVNAYSGGAVNVTVDGELELPDEEVTKMRCHLTLHFDDTETQIYMESTEQTLTLYTYYSETDSWFREEVDLPEAAFHTEKGELFPTTGEADWEAWVQQAGLEAYILPEEMPALLQRLEEKLNDRQYLTEELGYSETVANGETIYSLSPRLESVGEDFLKELQPVLTDKGREETEAFTHEELFDALNKLSVTAGLTVDSQYYLSACQLHLGIDPGLAGKLGLGISELSLQATFSDFNSITVEIPEEARTSSVD